MKSPYGNNVFCYDIERTICDIIRDKSKIERYQFTDAMKRYANLKVKDISKLYKYAEKFNIKEEVKKYVEVLNYINRSSSKSIEDIKAHKEKIEERLPELKGNRQNLWRKYKNLDTAEEKHSVLEQINLISDKICTMYGQKNACNRIIKRYEDIKDECIKDECIKEKEAKTNVELLIKNGKQREKV